MRRAEAVAIVRGCGPLSERGAVSGASFAQVRRSRRRATARRPYDRAATPTRSAPSANARARAHAPRPNTHSHTFARASTRRSHWQPLAASPCALPRAFATRRRGARPGDRAPSEPTTRPFRAPLRGPTANMGIMATADHTEVHADQDAVLHLDLLHDQHAHVRPRPGGLDARADAGHRRLTSRDHRHRPDLRRVWLPGYAVVNLCVALFVYPRGTSAEIKACESLDLI